VAELVRSARQVLPVGAQSSLTGGATPRGDVVISTRALNAIGDVATGDMKTGTVRAGAGVPLSALQRALAPSGHSYPPVPTYDGAFLGGTISTNAAGAATFKYGSARRWVERLTVVLADGAILDLTRGDVTASLGGWFALEPPGGTPIRIPVPTYAMPDVAKLSAGYYARPGMDLVDLFVGSEGTLGFIVDCHVRVIRRPRACAALVRCDSDAQAVALTAAPRTDAAASWRGEGPLDVSAVEFMDHRSLAVVPDEAFARAGTTRPHAPAVLLLVQIEVPRDADAALERLQQVLDACGVDADPQIAMPEDAEGAARLFELREAVPASVNALVAAAKHAHRDVEKTAGDLVVPFARLGESLALYRRAFEEASLPYAIWGHASDGNLHPNVVPRSWNDVERGREAILEMARAVIAMGGAPLAEHGVGRSALKQRLLRELYGDRGIEEMRAVKRALDPEWKFSPGVLFPK
jgi:D-lactate dehydrogenase (cytochrome)